MLHFQGFLHHRASQKTKLKHIRLVNLTRQVLLISVNHLALGDMEQHHPGKKEGWTSTARTNSGLSEEQTHLTVIMVARGPSLILLLMGCLKLIGLLRESCRTVVGNIQQGFLFYQLELLSPGSTVSLGKAVLYLIRQKTGLDCWTASWTPVPNEEHTVAHVCWNPPAVVLSK